MLKRHRITTAMAGGALVVACLSVASLPATVASAASIPLTTTITATGETEYFLPPFTTSLQVTVIGAAGNSEQGVGAPGQGAEVTATITPPPGLSTLWAVVALGWGTSDYGALGGGESALQTCSLSTVGCTYTADPTTDPRLIVAAGGGGGGEDIGSATGGSGGSAGASSSVTGPGQGGNGTDSGNGGGNGGSAGYENNAISASGGAGASSCGGKGAGGAGSPGSGGSGGTLIYDDPGIDSSGGGGGGGWVGGSGGGAGDCLTLAAPGGGGGGGAGSSYVENSATNVSIASAGSASPEVVITATVSRVVPPSQAENDTASAAVTEVGPPLAVVTSTTASGNLLTDALNLANDPSTITGLVSAKGAIGGISGVNTIDGTYGTLTVNSNTGAYTYSLDTGVVPACGTDTDVFTYTLSDNYGLSSTATLTVSLGVTCQPLSQAENDTNSVNVSEVGSTVTSSTTATGNLLANALNLTSDPSSITSISDTNNPGGVSPTNGVITIDGTFGTLTVQTTGGNAGAYTYTLDNGVVPSCAGGTDTFTYTLTDASSLSSSATLTVTLDVSCQSPPPLAPAPSVPISINLCPNGEVTCAAASSTTPGGSASATNDGTTGTASGGEGTLYVGQYGSDPDTALSSGDGEYFDVLLEPGNTFTSVTITDTNLNGGDSLVWWNGSAWVPVVGDPGPTYSPGPPPSVTVTLNSTTSPTLAQLTATPFAVVSAYVPGAPSGLVATAANASASFSWNPPSSNGGAPVTSYTLTCSPSGSVTTTSTGAAIIGLQDATTYSCAVAATNAAGTGPSSGLVFVTPSAPSTTPSPTPTPTPFPGPSAPSSPTSPAPSAGPCASYSANAAFICSVYEDLLQRAPDAPGLSNFEAQLASGSSRAQVSYEILTSTEYRDDLVGAIYENFLQRPADPGGLSTFVGLLGSGANQEQVIADLVGSQEFFSDAGATNQSFVTLAYEKILGRSPDASGLATFTGMLESRTSRTQVAYDLLSSNEYRTDAISFYYEYLLGRAPDPGGLGTGLALLNTGDTVEQFISDIVGSAEYYTDATAS